MTIIVYRDGVVAADRRLVSSGWIVGTTRKLHPVRGWVAGVWGDPAMASRMLQWLRERDPALWLSDPSRPKLEEVSMLLCSSEQRIILQTDGWSEITDDWCCHGSGRPPARAALIMGASASRAVEVASMIEGNCGDGVDTLETSSHPRIGY